MSSAKEALTLYRCLLRKGQQLKLTDKQYFYTRIRTEFEQNRFLEDESKVKYCIEKGWAFLKKDRLL